MSDKVSAVKATWSWRELLPRCLAADDSMEGIVSSLLPEEWDERWNAKEEYTAPEMVAWSANWVYYSKCHVDDGLLVFRVPRNPLTGSAAPPEKK